MGKKIDSEARKRAVFTAALRRYIKNAAPVASEDMAEEFKLSSATIRNIFAELEANGLLKHPYTSGGRIPTKKGYRFYVDFLLSEMELIAEEKEHIVTQYKRELNQLDDILEKTSEVISLITHHAGIVSFIEWQDRIFYKGIGYILAQPELQDIERMRILITMMEDKKKFLDIVNRNFNEKVKVYIGDELGFPGMEEYSLVVSDYHLKNRPSGKLAVFGPMRMEYDHIVPTLEYISSVLSNALEKAKV